MLITAISGFSHTMEGSAAFTDHEYKGLENVPGKQ